MIISAAPGLAGSRADESTVAMTARRCAGLEVTLTRLSEGPDRESPAAGRGVAVDLSRGGPSSCNEVLLACGDGDGVMGRYRLHGFVTVCPGSPALSWVLGFIPSRLLWGGLQVGTGQPRAFWSRDLIQANSLGTPRAGAQSWALSPVECCPRWGVPSLTVTMQDCPSQVPAWGLSQSRAPTRGGGAGLPKASQSRADRRPGSRSRNEASTLQTSGHSRYRNAMQPGSPRPHPELAGLCCLPSAHGSQPGPVPPPAGDTFWGRQECNLAFGKGMKTRLTCLSLLFSPSLPCPQLQPDTVGVPDPVFLQAYCVPGMC